MEARNSPCRIVSDVGDVNPSSSGGYHSFQEHTEDGIRHWPSLFYGAQLIKVLRDHHSFFTYCFLMTDEIDLM